MTQVCLTFDFDAVSIWVSTFKQTTATAISRGEYGGRVGIFRVLDLLKEVGVSATFFIPAHTAKSFSKAVKQIFEAGHEIAVHGYCHESPVGLSVEDERRLLIASKETLHSLLGNSCPLVGYRSPAWDLSNNSISLLEELGFLYDSSMMADDFSPYHPRKSFVVNEDGFSPGETSKLIEMPVAWELDDFPYFQFLAKPLNAGLRKPSDVYDIWKSEFDFCHGKISDGVFTLTMHPEIIGRGPRIEMLAQLISHIKSCKGVEFTTLASAAKRAAANG